MLAFASRTLMVLGEAPLGATPAPIRQHPKDSNLEHSCQHP